MLLDCPSNRKFGGHELGRGGGSSNGVEGEGENGGEAIEAVRGRGTRRGGGRVGVLERGQETEDKEQRTRGDVQGQSGDGGHQDD